MSEQQALTGPIIAELTGFAIEKQVLKRAGESHHVIGAIGLACLLDS